jgi:hypothetical protein
MRCLESKIVVASLTAISIWLFVVLPIYYGNIMLETAKDIATICAVLFGAVSTVIALLAFRTNRENQKEAVLQKAYFDYAKMAIDNPDFAFPFKSKIDLDKETFGKDDKLKFEKYEWFVSSMLVMCLFVTRMRRDDNFWKGLVINQIAYHWQYIEYFWDKKEFILNWRTELEARMIEGIHKGKEKLKPEKPSTSWTETI